MCESVEKTFLGRNKDAAFCKLQKNPVNVKRSRLNPRQVQQLRYALELHSQDLSSGIVHSETNFI